MDATIFLKNQGLMKNGRGSKMGGERRQSGGPGRMRKSCQIFEHVKKKRELILGTHKKGEIKVKSKIPESKTKKRPSVLNGIN